MLGLDRGRLRRRWADCVQVTENGVLDGLASNVDTVSGAEEETVSNEIESFEKLQNTLRRKLLTARPNRLVTK